MRVEGAIFPHCARKWLAIAKSLFLSPWRSMTTRNVVSPTVWRFVAVCYTQRDNYDNPATRIYRRRDDKSFLVIAKSETVTTTVFEPRQGMNGPSLRNLRDRDYDSNEI